MVNFQTDVISIIPKNVVPVKYFWRNSRNLHKIRTTHFHYTTKTVLSQVLHKISTKWRQGLAARKSAPCGARKLLKVYHVGEVFEHVSIFGNEHSPGV